MRKVFISYCHRDDLPFGPRELRWVETFEKALQETLGQRVGPGRVALWRDKRRMSGATLFDETIKSELRDADMLITVLSRHYLDSAYCQQELRCFGEQRIASGGLNVNATSRILKVYRAAIDRGDLRRFADLPEIASVIDGSTGYLIYCTDDEGNDRDALLDPRGIDLVWQKADDLAKTIKAIVDAGGVAPAPPPHGSGAAHRVVYLARTATDLREAREALRRELEDRGHLVLPASEAAEEAAAYGEQAAADMARAQLSVHLLGERFGTILEGGGNSGVALQADLALQAQHADFATLFWSPPETARRDAAMGALVERLSGLSLPASRAEYVCSSLDQLKALMLARLTAPPPPPPLPVPTTPAAPGAAAAAPRSIYLVCDPNDREATRPVKQALEALGFEVTRPPQEGSPEELLDDHKSCLVACDAVAIVWGKAREPWVRNKLRDLQQAPGWGRNRPFLARLVIVGPPDTPAKQDFDPPAGVRVLQATEVAAALAPMLQ